MHRDTDVTGDGGTADPCQRLLARGVDVKDEDFVRALQCLGELARESSCARIEMRLEYDDAAGAGDGRVAGGILFDNRPHRCQRGPDLGRMVRIVVENPHPCGTAHQFETAAHTIEPRQSVEH